MKVVILAGGRGSRLQEETDSKPKPMVEIGERPMLWHIMKIYSHFGFNDFIVCLGYKSMMIKQYFLNYLMYQNDCCMDIGNNKLDFVDPKIEPWKITFLNTGLETMTGGRIRRVQKYVGSETFMLTYGDGVADVNIAELVDFHKTQKKLATLTAVQPFGRFGMIRTNGGNLIEYFNEKQKGDGSWVNGGFFVLEPGIFDFIQGDATIWENEPIHALSQKGQLCAYKHGGFWMCMDTLRDKDALERFWKSQQPPWKIWQD